MTTINRNGIYSSTNSFLAASSLLSPAERRAAVMTAAKRKVSDSDLEDEDDDDKDDDGKDDDDAADSDVTTAPETQPKTKKKKPVTGTKTKPHPSTPAKRVGTPQKKAGKKYKPDAAALSTSAILHQKRHTARIKAVGHRLDEMTTAEQVAAHFELAEGVSEISLAFTRASAQAKNGAPLRRQGDEVDTSHLSEHQRDALRAAGRL